MRLNDRICLEFWILLILKKVIRWFGEGIKTFWEALAEPGDCILQARSKTAREINESENISALHHRQQLVRWSSDDPFRSHRDTIDRFCGIGEMGMEIDDRVFCSRYMRFLQADHADRLILRQRKGFSVAFVLCLGCLRTFGRFATPAL